MAGSVDIRSLRKQLGLCLFFLGVTASAQTSFQGSFAQVASGSGITTTIVLVNTAGTPARTQVGFYLDEGGQLSLPLTLPQTGISTNTSALDQTIAPYATFIAVSTGPSNLPPLVGSARVTSDGRVDGFIIYHFAWSGQEAIVRMEKRVASAYLLPFDSRELGFPTGIAIANTTAGNVDVSVGMRIGGAGYVDLGMLTLPASGHTAFVLDQKFPSTTLLSGIIEFRATAGQVSVIGLRVDPYGHTTALPVLTDATPFSGSLAQLAAGGGIATGMELLNVGSTDANIHVRFLADDGSPLSVFGGVTGFGCSPSAGSFFSIDRTFGPGTLCGVVAVRGTTNSPAVGSAEVTTDSSAIGWVSYTFPTNEVFVPLETRIASSFVLPYDNRSAVVTGVAVANVDGQAAVIPVTIRDEAGAPVFSGEINLAAQGHTSFVLAQRFPASASIRGTMEFKTPVGGRISVLGLRVAPAGSVSSIPILVP